MSFTAPALDSPHLISRQLIEIEADLAARQNALEHAARSWFVSKRNKERARAVAFLNAQGQAATVAERSAIAEAETATDGVEAEAEWEALRAVVRTLETRASICQSLLKVGLVQ